MFCVLLNRDVSIPKLLYNNLQKRKKIFLVIIAVLRIGDILALGY